MKKSILLLALVLSCTALASCKNDSGKTAPSPTPTFEANEETKKAAEDIAKLAEENKENNKELLDENKQDTDNAVIAIADMELKIKSYSIVPSAISEDEEDVYLYLEFVNNSGAERSLSDCIFTVSQDGVRLNSGLYFEKESSTKVASGQSIDIMLAKALRNGEKDVTITFGVEGNTKDYKLKLK